MPKPDTFATRLAALRREAALSVAELAQRAGLTRQYLHLLERGQREPSLRVAADLAAALGRDLTCWN